MSEEVARLRLARTDGVGPITYRRLLRRYQSAEAALDALPGLARAGGRAAPLSVPPAATVEREIDRITRLRGRLLFLDTPDYPPLLGLLDDAPSVLAVLGNVAVLSRRAMAMVGSRNASSNGQRLAEQLAQQLTEAGFVVVSGLARGIDAAAHEGALRTGQTVACVAGGVDVPYPPEHASLQARIVGGGGAVVAEMPPGTAPTSPALHPPQPRHRRPVARRGGGRGRDALRRAGHGPRRPGQQPGSLRRARLAARPALPRHQRPAAARCDTGGNRRGRD